MTVSEGVPPSPLYIPKVSIRIQQVLGGYNTRHTQYHQCKQLFKRASGSLGTLGQFTPKNPKGLLREGLMLVTPQGAAGGLWIECKGGGGSYHNLQATIQATKGTMGPLKHRYTGDFKSLVDPSRPIGSDNIALTFYSLLYSVCECVIDLWVSFGNLQSPRGWLFVYSVNSIYFFCVLLYLVLALVRIAAIGQLSGSPQPAHLMIPERITHHENFYSIQPCDPITSNDKLSLLYVGLLWVAV